MEGTVIKWIDKKGYGFIGVDGQKDIFVHYSDIKKEGFISLKIGQKVKFDVEETDKGPRAKNVELLE
ncbi:MAG: cold shock domain-containing protein [Thermoplasmata archaeon]|nr:cold shock domain-containing protein [Thermoplasmata archaeon]